MALALKATSERYQPLSPVAPEISPEITGGRVSSPPLAEPIRDVSPQEEIAQKAKSLVPSTSGTSQSAPRQAKVSPPPPGMILRVPSRARML